MCGIIGIFNYKNSNIIILELLESLKKLQNRGRDSYGILLSNSDMDTIIKEKELITIENIRNLDLDNSRFNIVLGHSRYATSYDTNNKSSVNKSHPFKGTNIILGDFFLVHNGNINFPDSLKRQFKELSDSEILVKIIETINKETWPEIIAKIINDIPGVFNIILKTKNYLYAFKDRYNMRPLCLGKSIYGYSIVSESNALSNYNYIKEIRGGQIVQISSMGVKTFNIMEHESKMCLFEFIYFLNPNSKINDQKIFNLRFSLGSELARNENYLIDKKNKDNIVVIGSPDTGIPSGMGFADSLDLKYEQFLEKNKNRGRSFILADNSSRKNECNKKFLVNPDFSIKDKIVFFIDDSIVRGNTTKRIISLLEEYGAKEINIRISSPKIINICKFGIDIPTKDELIMNKMDEKQFVIENNINSLRYLELDDMERVIGMNINVNKKFFCNGCFSGNYKKELLDW